MRFYRIVLSILLILCGFGAFAQNKDSAVDKALDEYESLLKEAISLKRSSDAGERVLEYEIYSLASRLSAIRKSLGSGNKMTNAQKERLAALIKWYETAEKGYEAGVVWVSPVVDTLKTAVVSSDFTPKKVVPVEIAGLLIDPAFKPFRVHPFLSVTVSGFDAVLPGARIGFARKRWGGYLSAQMSPEKLVADYTCLSNGSIPAGGAIYTNGVKSLYHFSVSAGALYLPVRFYGLDTGGVGVYAGAGYGERNLYWQDIEAKWALVEDRSWQGVGVEAGLIVLWKRLTFSAGTHITGFAHADFEAGIGVRF